MSGESQISKRSKSQNKAPNRHRNVRVDRQVRKMRKAPKAPGVRREQKLMTSKRPTSSRSLQSTTGTKFQKRRTIQQNKAERCKQMQTKKKQKMARKAQEQQHELEMAKIKADVDKSVGVAQAEAKAQVLKRKFESEDSKKNEKNRS